MNIEKDHRCENRQADHDQYDGSDHSTFSLELHNDLTGDIKKQKGNSHIDEWFHSQCNSKRYAD